MGGAFLGAAAWMLEVVEATAYLHAAIREIYERSSDAAIARLGGAAFAAWVEGRALTPEQPVAYALVEW